MAEGKTVFGKSFNASAIGATMSEACRHAFDDALLNGPDDATHPAHGNLSSVVQSLFVNLRRDYALVHTHQHAEDQPRSAVQKSQSKKIHPEESDRRSERRPRPQPLDESFSLQWQAEEGLADDVGGARVRRQVVIHARLPVRIAIMPFDKVKNAFKILVQQIVFQIFG